MEDLNIDSNSINPKNTFKEETKEDTKEETKDELIDNKLKEIFYNSFNTESIDKQDNNDGYCVVEKNEVLYEVKGVVKNKEYNEINNRFKKELNLKRKYKKFHLFYNNCESLSDEKVIYKFGKILLFTYRKNFPKITNYKNHKTFTTDAWWGCMIRCGQMILSRGIYRLLKKEKFSTKDALFYTVALFRNYPIKENNLHVYFNGMLKKYKSTLPPDKTIKDFFPPFSIKTLCEVGELFERTAGEWFSDVIITNCFKYISEYYNLFTQQELQVKIITFQSCLQIQDILDACFEQKEYVKGNEQFIKSKGKYYYYKKKGIIFVNIRVGLETIPVEYYKGIRDLFSLKECIGIIGGKTRQAYYFIGYVDDENSLLYLDPHVIKDSDKEVNNENILTKNINKEIHSLKMNRMSTAFTIGFCFRDYEEFLELFGFWQKAKQKEYPILGVIKQPIVVDVKDDIEESDKLTEPYEDKEEDDF